MLDPIFNISNLTCEYVKGTPVLEIGQLNIPKGKLVIIIGKSGIGKSTLIETLGLMNNTIASKAETSVMFQPSKGIAHELKDSWGKSNEQLATFRRNHFSFIFQNTNLMPNFSSGENMMVSLLIKGKTRNEAKSEVLSVMDRLSLSREIFNKKITEISGGQRQRLAFVRAITADFTVMFGDEPTGNLDRNTSEDLMEILREILHTKEKTGVIVSHDLVLAEKYADVIVPITMDTLTEGTLVGKIVETNIIQKTGTGWMGADGKYISNPITFLNNFLTASNTIEPQTTVIK